MKKKIVLAVLSLVLLGCGGRGEQASYTGVLEGRSVRVPALVGGRITAVKVDVGDVVQTGDTLAVLDTVELDLQRQQLAAGLEELAVQREIAATQLQTAKNNLEYARQRFERVKKLFQQQAAPQQRLDDAQNQLRTVEAAYQSARQRMRQVTAKEKQLRAQLALMDQKIKDAVVVSPLNATVASRYFEPGEAVAPFQPVVELIHLQEMDLKIYIPEEKLAKIKIGQKVKVQVDGHQQAFTGKIVWISPKAEFTPKTIMTPETRVALVYAVKVRVKNPEGVLKHGMPAEAWLE